MPVLKRATARLKAAGVILEVRSSLYGYYLSDPKLKAQTGATVYKNIDQAIAAALAGERAEPLEGQEVNKPSARREGQRE